MLAVNLWLSLSPMERTDLQNSFGLKILLNPKKPNPKTLNRIVLLKTVLSSKCDRTVITVKVSLQSYGQNRQRSTPWDHKVNLLFNATCKRERVTRFLLTVPFLVDKSISLSKSIPCSCSVGLYLHCSLTTSRAALVAWRTWYAFCRCWRHRVTRRVLQIELNARFLVLINDLSYGPKVLTSVCRFCR